METLDLKHKIIGYYHKMDTELIKHQQQQLNYETKSHLVKEVADQVAKCVAMTRILSENTKEDLQISISMFLVDLMGYSIGLHWVADVVKNEILKGGKWSIDFSNATFEKKNSK